MICSNSIKNADATVPQTLVLDTDTSPYLPNYNPSLLDVSLSATASVDFHLEYSDDGENWYEAYSGSGTSYHDAWHWGFRYARLRTDAAASGTVTLMLSAK